SHPAGPHPTATLAAPTVTATLAGPTVLFQNSLASTPSSDWTNDPSVGCFFAGGYHDKDAFYCPIDINVVNVSANVNLQDATNYVQNADITVQVKQIGGSP